MKTFPVRWYGAVVLAIAGVLPAAETVSSADHLRGLERKRLRALVDSDVGAARSIHADDFELITPHGGKVTRGEYLALISSGELDYLVWEPESEISVRVEGKMASLRYRSRLEVTFRGSKTPLRRYWHTDVYENRDGRWQVVWSHATEIRE